MAVESERELVAPCRRWMQSFLTERFPRANIVIPPDTERRELRRAIADAGLESRFPEITAWEVQVDVVGIVYTTKRIDLSFVELKVGPIKLVDVGQLLGYCRVCRPAEAFLLSPSGISADLRRLLETYGRLDILTFDGRTIQVGSWDSTNERPRWNDMIPGGVMPSART